MFCCFMAHLYIFMAIFIFADIFADCRGSSMDVFFDACIFDLCATNLNTSIICESAQEFASSCEDAGGTPGDWQAALPQCGKVPP